MKNSKIYALNCVNPEIFESYLKLNSHLLKPIDENNILIKTPVNECHTGTIQLCTNRSGDRYYGEIMQFDSGTFACKHADKKIGGYRTTGTIITHIFT